MEALVLQKLVPLLPGFEVHDGPTVPGTVVLVVKAAGSLPVHTLPVTY